jgi:hypothetical protein
MRQGTREYNEMLIRVLEDDPGGNKEKIERLKNIGGLMLLTDYVLLKLDRVVYEKHNSDFNSDKGS